MANNGTALWVALGAAVGGLLWWGNRKQGAEAKTTPAASGEAPAATAPGGGGGTPAVVAPGPQPAQGPSYSDYDEPVLAAPVVEPATTPTMAATAPSATLPPSRWFIGATLNSREGAFLTIDAVQWSPQSQIYYYQVTGRWSATEPVSTFVIDERNLLIGAERAGLS